MTYIKLILIDEFHNSIYIFFLSSYFRFFLAVDEILSNKKGKKKVENVIDSGGIRTHALSDWCLKPAP